MSTPNPALVAAVPSLVAILKAVLQFNGNMGPDPQQWALKFPGASQVLLGTISMQLPAIAIAEAGVVQNDINAKVNAYITSLEALTTPPAA